MSDNEDESYSVQHSQHSSDDSSIGYEGADWLEHVASDGSLFYVESYVSSTVREKQAIALSTSREKKNLSSKIEEKSESKMVKIKKENKLLGLLRRRPSIRGKASEKLSLFLTPSSSAPEEANPSQEVGSTGKPGGRTSNAKQGQSAETRDTSPAPKVTFRDNKSGEMRTVALHVVAVGDGRGGLCEAVLGVVAGRFSEPPTHRIMVAGILPGSEAHTTHAIKIDCPAHRLPCSHGSGVLWHLCLLSCPAGVFRSLGATKVPSVVTLGLQKCASETLTDQDHRNRKRITQTQLVKHITGHSIQELSATSVTGSSAPLPSDLVKGAPPHVALLLSLAGVTDTSPEGSDIRYQFPRGSSRLVRVRGVFLTLAHTLHDLTGQHASSSSVQLGGEELVHVVYRREGELVWVMALPHQYCSEHELLCISQHVTDDLCFEFGSLEKSVGDSAQHPYIDHLMGKVFCSVLQAPQYRHRLHRSLLHNSPLPRTHYLHPLNYLADHLLSQDAAAGVPCKNPLVSGPSAGSNLWSILSAPSWLLLQDGGRGGGGKMAVDGCLSELEAGDFGEEEDENCEECAGLDHSIEGCCLFYKGAVVCSHLPPSLLRRVHAFARLHGILALTAAEAVSQMIVWRHVHPLTDDDTRSALLLVAMNHLVIAMIVEENQLPQRSTPWRDGPDPLLVEQVEATLFHLHSLHIPALCQDSLSHGGPEVISPDAGFPSFSGRGGKKGDEAPLPATGSPPPTPLPDVPSILKQRRPSPPAPDPVEGEDPYCQPPLGHLVGEEDGDDEAEDIPIVGEHSQWRLWRGHTPPPSLRGSDADPAPLCRLPATAIRVMTGPTPALFHLIHLDVGEGVMIEALPAPRCLPSAPHPPPLHDAVLNNFRAACVNIHSLLNSPLFAQLSVDGSGDGAREHGVLFSCAPAPSTTSKKRPLAPFNYWVVGRVVPASSREVYVCYHESVPQNLPEMAARLCLGATL